MSLTTSARLNADQLQAALPAGAAFSSAGADLTSTGSKVITFIGADDATGQAAITTAVGQFVDRTANLATMQAKIDAAIGQMNTWIANNPNGAVLTAPQTLILIKFLNDLAKVARGQLDSTTGT